MTIDEQYQLAQRSALGDQDAMAVIMASMQ